MTEPSAADDSTGGQRTDLAAELAQALAPEVAGALVKRQADFRTPIIFDRWLVPGLRAPGNLGIGRVVRWHRHGA